MALVLTPKDVLDHVHATDGDVDVLDSAFGKCAQLSADELTAWTNFRNDWKTFAAGTEKQWSGLLASNGISVLFGGPAMVLQQSALQDDEGHIADTRNALVAWHVKAKAKCGLDIPPPSPAPSPEDPKSTFAKTLEHIAIAGAVIVGGVVLLVGVSYVAKGVRVAKAVL